MYSVCSMAMAGVCGCYIYAYSVFSCASFCTLSQSVGLCLGGGWWLGLGGRKLLCSCRISILYCIVCTLGLNATAAAADGLEYRLAG